MAKRGRKSNAERAAVVAGVTPGQLDALIEQQRTPPPEESNETAGAEIVAKPLPSERTGVYDKLREGYLLAVACKELGLLPEHIAAHRFDLAEVVIVTRGGVKLRWPDDIERARALPQPQKDGQFPGGVNPNSKAWNETPEKNAALVAAVAAAQPKEPKQ